MTDCAGVRSSGLVVVAVPAGRARGTVKTCVAVRDAVFAVRCCDGHVDVGADTTAANFIGVLCGWRCAGAGAGSGSGVASGGAETAVAPAERLVHPVVGCTETLVDVVDSCSRRRDQSLVCGAGQAEVRLVLEAETRRARPIAVDAHSDGVQGLVGQTADASAAGDDSS